MFIGHAACGFAAKRAAPRVSLAWLLVAPWLLDLLWPVFLLTRVEHVRIVPGITAFSPMDFFWFPWSHSLLMALAWSVLAAWLYRTRGGDARGAWVIAALVTSHWVLDLVVHRPDLQITPWMPQRVGLGLWNSIPGTLIVEGGSFAAGLAIYVASTRATDWKGNVGLVSLALFLVAIYAASETGPPPPSTDAIAWVTLLFGALLVPWALWIERHRVARAA